MGKSKIKFKARSFFRKMRKRSRSNLLDLKSSNIPTYGDYITRLMKMPVSNDVRIPGYEISDNKF